MKGLGCLSFLFLATVLFSQTKDSTYFWTQFVVGRDMCTASDFYDAKVLLEKVLSEVRDSDYKDFDLEARIMTDLAWAYSGLKDKVSENIYIESALKIYADNLSLESEEYAAILHDMALTQGGRGNYQYAIELLDSSNVIFKKYVPDFYNAGRASNLVTLGWIYREHNKYDEAIIALKEGVRLINIEGGDRYTDLGSAHHILGYTLMYNGNHAEALPNLIKGKKFRAQRYGTSHPLYNQSLQKISECYTNLEEYDKANDYLDTIIFSMQADNFENSNNEIQLDSIKSWYTLLQTYVSKGNIYLYKYRANQDIAELEMNLLWYKKAIDAIQKILLYYPSKEARFQMLKKYSFLFDYAVNQAVLLYDRFDDPKYLEKAFQISEINRGFSFLEALHQGQATENYDVPKELLEKESVLTIKMQKFEQGNEIDIENSNEWIELKLELQKVQQKIKKNYPSYYDLKSNLIVPTIKDIKSNLNNDVAIIEFFEGSNKLFVFVITTESADVLTINISQDYREVLARLISNISKNPITHNIPLKVLKNDSKKGYQWLISPIDSFIQSKQKLVFIPHKILNYLPFEVLISNDSSSVESKYLIQDYSISYDYSCASLFSQVSNTAICKYEYHGFAPGISNQNFPDESINEVKQAVKILGGKYSIKNSANRSNLRKGLKNAKIVHIAAHSILDTLDISKYAIILNDRKSKTSKDSILIEDIYLSDINSELVILSGCQTADGVWKDGEGLLSLTNAFKYAGAKSLTCSLWETENKVGNEIMTKYISNLKKGLDKDYALRSAKLQFFDSVDPLLKHPFYWSTFVNVGNQEPISNLKNNDSRINLKYIFGLIFLMIAFGILLLSKRKTTKLGNVSRQGGIK